MLLKAEPYGYSTRNRIGSRPVFGTAGLTSHTLSTWSSFARQLLCHLEVAVATGSKSRRLGASEPAAETLSGGASRMGICGFPLRPPDHCEPDWTSHDPSGL